MPSLPNDNFRSPLMLDNDTPYVGNSTGPDGRGRVHTKISNTTAEPVPVEIVDGTPGIKFFSDIFDEPTTPGADQTLLSFTVPVSTLRQVNKVNVTLRQESYFWIEADGLKVGSGLTGPGQKSEICFNPTRPFSPGTLIEVKLKQRNGSAVTTVDCVLSGSDSAV